MEQMIGPKRPFYKAGPVMRLRKIPGEVFAEFLEERFRRSGLAGDARPRRGDRRPGRQSSVRRAASRARDLGRRLAAHGGSASSVEDLHATLHRLLTEQDTLFEAVWQRLTLAQRSTHARRRARARRRPPRRRDPRRGTASAAPRASRPRSPPFSAKISIVREDDGHYAVVDSLMREWVARKTY